MSDTKTKEPLIRIIKRDRSSFGYKVWVRAAAIILALVVDAIFIYSVTGLNPLSVYGVMLNGTFMTSIRFSWAMRDLVTLLCIGIALAPAFKMRFWNIGAEGQVLMGGLATAMVMVKCGASLPTPALFLVMFLTSVIAGGLWGFIPAVFKAYWNTNETLFTLMMNYVATSIVACMTNILRGKASSLGKLNMSTQVGWFPQFMGQRYNINILIVMILMFVMFFYLKYSKQGYEITVVGESENTARYAGINVKWVTIRTMIISGAICGLVGFLIGPPISGFMSWLGSLINWGTEQQPFLMGIIVSVLMGMILTLPISSAALGVILNLSGLAAGAATVGCCCNMVGFAVASYRENKVGGLLAQGIGTSMLQVPNIVKKPVIWLPAIISSAILGPVGTMVLHMTNNATGSGMGTAGLVGQIMTWQTMIQTESAQMVLIKILLIQIVLPAVVTLGVSEFMRKKDWIKMGDMKLEF